MYEYCYSNADAILKGSMNDVTQIMVLWVDCTGKLSNIPFIDNQGIFFFQPVLLSCLLCHRQRAL